VKLVDSFDASWDYVANDGTAFTFKTNLDAPRYRVVRADLGQAAADSSSSSSGPSSWPDVIPQHPKDLLQSALALKGDELVVRWV
jgi:prolyl oligopeptidase